METPNLFKGKDVDSGFWEKYLGLWWTITVKIHCKHALESQTNKSILRFWVKKIIREEMENDNRNESLKTHTYI